MSEEPIAREERVNFADNISLWGRQPLLQPQGSNFQGRVFVEVWDQKETRLVMTSEYLVAVVLEALEGKRPYVSAHQIPLTNKPATGDVPEQTFVGRVVVEVWNDLVVVGVSGSQSIVLEKALKALRS
jgi:hypothetical protein